VFCAVRAHIGFVSKIVSTRRREMFFAMVIRIPETNANSQSTEAPDMMPYQTLRLLGVRVPRCRRVRLSCH
jgi:hypothetical protein